MMFYLAIILNYISILRCLNNLLPYSITKKFENKFAGNITLILFTYK